MKKFFIPLFLALLLSCSSEDFKPSEKAASEQKSSRCYVEHSQKFYDNISESICLEMGGEPEIYCPVDVCIPAEESSSSRNAVSSSSRIGSSSSRASSSSRGGSSSSDGESSSSEGDDDSSSSVVAVSSSSGGGVVSSSSTGNTSSSSVGISSSSSSPPSFGECSPFPYYVSKAKKEYIKNLIPSNGCGNVTYTPMGSGSGITITGDSISFANASASSTERSLTISASSTLCGSKNCPITVIIADEYRDARCNHQDTNHQDIFKVNLSNIKSTTTVIEYACCEPKNDYFLTCSDINYTLKIKSSTNPITSSGGNANLPDIEPIPEFNAQCPSYGNGSSPGDTLYRYPERILMTVINASAIPTGGFSCNSW